MIMMMNYCITTYYYILTIIIGSTNDGLQQVQLKRKESERAQSAR